MPTPCYLKLKELHKANQVIRDSIISCYPRGWEENHITHTWLSNLRDHASKISYASHYRINVIWDAFKLKGKLETNNGDIAFIVKITFQNGKSLSGVAFLEAKRIYEKSGKYDALDWSQLKRITNNSPCHHLLLYDFEEQELPNALLYSCCCWNDHSDSKNGIGIIVPTSHVLTYKETGRSLASIGYRLSEQIFLRYFRGLDLDFNQSLVESVKSGVPGGIQYLVFAHVNLKHEVDNELSLQEVLPSDSSGFSRLNSNDDRD